MRNTIQRKMVLDAVQNNEGHLTADMLYEIIAKTYPDISIATVYRNLNLLAELNQIKKINVPNGADRFDKTVAPHYHIECKECGDFSDVDFGYIEKIDDLIAGATGYELEPHDIVFRGICKKCREKEHDKRK